MTSSTKTSTKRLTPKQNHVLSALKRGKSIRQIAREMRIGPPGVYGHIRKIKAAGFEIPSTNGATTPEPEASQPAVPDTNGANALVADTDVPTIIRSQIEVAKEAIQRIDAEAEEMKARADLLGQQREAQSEQITRHETALGAYQQ